MPKRRMSFEPRDYLRHIMVEADYLVTNQTLQRAFVLSLGIIGEAARKIPEDFRAQHPRVDWRAMASMRDRLRHNSVRVEYALVWEEVRNRIPELRRQVASILEA